MLGGWVAGRWAGGGGWAGGRRRAVDGGWRTAGGGQAAGGRFRARCSERQTVVSTSPPNTSCRAITMPLQCISMPCPRKVHAPQPLPFSIRSFMSVRGLATPKQQVGVLSGCCTWDCSRTGSLSTRYARKCESLMFFLFVSGRLCAVVHNEHGTWAVSYGPCFCLFLLMCLYNKQTQWDPN